MKKNIESCQNSPLQRGSQCATIIKRTSSHLANFKQKEFFFLTVFLLTVWYRTKESSSSSPTEHSILDKVFHYCTCVS